MREERWTDCLVDDRPPERQCYCPYCWAGRTISKGRESRDARPDPPAEHFHPPEHERDAPDEGGE